MLGLLFLLIVRCKIILMLISLRPYFSQGFQSQNEPVSQVNKIRNQARIMTSYEVIHTMIS
uniref:Uncharacterized protein n=1 Tax=Rhizophora mucronata TaxID=61149 RepID=A0A2P2QLN8_RHIMU